jgi:hypothetical protein
MKTGETAAGLLLDALNGQSLDYMIVGSYAAVSENQTQPVRRME